MSDGKSSSLDLYLAEIQRTKLLSRDEEQALAKRIREGDRKAIDKLVKANTRFVVTVAKKYQGKGLPIEDLIGEGNRGLMIAAKKFDPKRGVRFISYAVWWIRQSIVQALSDHGYVVKVPINQMIEVNRIRRLNNKFERELGRLPTTEEISENLGITEDTARTLLNLLAGEVSLDAPLMHGDGSVHSHVGDSKTSDIAELLAMKSEYEEVRKAMVDLLSEREHKILVLLFGLYGNEAHTLEKIGIMLGITRERVRQIKANAIMKLSVHFSKTRLAEVAKDHLADEMMPTSDVSDMTPMKESEFQRLGRLRIREFLKFVCDEFDANFEDITGRDRARTHSLSRTFAMYYMFDVLKMSYLQIGREFSERGVTSIETRCRNAVTLLTRPKNRERFERIDKRFRKFVYSTRGQ